MTTESNFDYDDDDNSDDGSPYCECGNEPTIEEFDTDTCDACGKPLGHEQPVIATPSTTNK